MNLLGLALDDLLDLKNRHDVTVDGDDIIIESGEALPPPEIRGRLSKVGVSEGRLTLTYLSSNDAPADRGRRSPSPRNHVSFTGGTIRFGKLTMTDADLRLIDIDPRDSFDFFPAQYQRQLIAGYSRNTPAGGLRTFMPDYDDLVAGRRIASRSGTISGASGLCTREAVAALIGTQHHCPLSRQAEPIGSPGACFLIGRRRRLIRGDHRSPMQVEVSPASPTLSPSSHAQRSLTTSPRSQALVARGSAVPRGTPRGRQPARARARRSGPIRAECSPSGRSARPQRAAAATYRSSRNLLTLSSHATAEGGTGDGGQ